jgi:hypothetical protein
MINLNRSLRVIGVATGIALSGRLVLAQPIHAQGVNQPTPVAQNLMAQSLLDRFRWLFSPPPKTADRGTPSGRKKGGATQGICPPVDKPLTALVPNPEGSAAAELTMGVKTASDHPTFWFYVPYVSKSGRLAEFVLIDQNEADVFSTTIRLTTAPGIMGIQVPDKMPPLQVGKPYRWVFSVICDPSNRSGDVTVNGWIQREALPAAVQTQLQQTTLPSQRFALYAQAGLWYEALTTLATLRLTNPKDSTLQNWQPVLESAGLKELSAEPITTLNALPVVQGLPVVQ